MQFLEAANAMSAQVGVEARAQVAKIEIAIFLSMDLGLQLKVV